jgi:hypothetical protein
MRQALRISLLEFLIFSNARAKFPMVEEVVSLGCRLVVFLNPGFGRRPNLLPRLQREGSPNMATEIIWNIEERILSVAPIAAKRLGPAQKL